MKRVDLGQSISIIANLGVIAGIGFLALEFNQNNRLLSAESGFAVLQNRLASNAAVSEDAELAELVVRAYRGEELSEADVLRLTMRATNLLLMFEWHYSQNLSGNLSDIDVLLPAMQSTFENPAFFGLPEGIFWSTWESMGMRLSPNFIRFVEENVTRTAQR